MATKRHLQENLDRAAEAADNGNVDESVQTFEAVGKASI